MIIRGVASPDCPGGQSWWASRWRVSASCALARTGGCLRGDVPPSEAGRFWNFDTEFTQFSDNFYAKFIPLEMFKYLWNIMFINVSYKSAMFFNLGLGLNVSVKVGGSLHTGTPSISLINFGVRTYAQKVPLPFFFPFPPFFSSLFLSFPFSLFLPLFLLPFLFSFSLFFLPFSLFSSFPSFFFPFPLFPLPDFCSPSRFLVSGGAVCPPCPPIGYAPELGQ